MPGSVAERVPFTLSDAASIHTFLEGAPHMGVGKGDIESPRSIVIRVSEELRDRWPSGLARQFSREESAAFRAVAMDIRRSVQTANDVLRHRTLAEVVDRIARWASPA